MTDHYDIVIAGAGCAGLSFAWHLLDAGIQGRRVAVIDRSFELSADKLWCFWGPETMPFADVAAHRWDRAIVHTDEATIDESLGSQAYHCVRSEAFGARVLARLEAAPEVTLLAADILDMGEDAGGAFVVTSEGTVRSDWVAQSMRYSPEDAAKSLAYPVRQHFGGLEIKTAEPVFDTGAFTMMDFRVPQRDGVAFVYVLPFAPDRALIEHTMFSSSPLSAEAHFEASEAYIRERLGVDYDVERRESGSLPMDDRYPSQQSSARVFNLGIVGGQMKPSTGYAFARIQRHTQALATHFAATGRLTTLPSASTRFRFYDVLLLRILHEAPRYGARIFGALFAQRGVQRVLNFLDERTRFREELALVWRLPWWPFLRGIPRALSLLRRRAVVRRPTHVAPGLMMAFTVLALWATSMVLGLNYRHPGAGSWWADGAWVAVQTFLSTGVFITAHDAMHGLIAPGHRRLNRAVGWLATWSYAGLDYDALERAHHAHHAEPATEHDPDFHRGKPGFISWYVDFMQQYLSWRQFGWLCLLLGGMIFALELPVAHVAAFWAAPLILSTFQLFTVGTWLPHRPGHYLGDGPLRARSVDIAPLWSFLACYHFGYHFEHHARPDLPWWRLWRVRGFRTAKV